jgi:DNA polymerase II small subunit/DNA polymerase delta subunit B
VYKRIISVVKRDESVSDRISYIRLIGRGCDIIVLNTHDPTEDRIDYVKDIYEELKHALDKFLKFHMKILLGYFNTKAYRSLL